MHQQNINPNHLESNIAAYVLPKALPFRWQKNPRCSDERTQRSSPGWLKGSKRMGRSLKEQLFSSHFHPTFPDQEPQPVPIKSITIRQWKAPWLCCFYKILQVVNEVFKTSTLVLRKMLTIAKPSWSKFSTHAAGYLGTGSYHGHKPQ